MEPKVTWILPVRNAARYLDETLASLEAQTFSEYVVLAWDNGSDDETVEILKRWIPTKLPGRVITDRPCGLGACLREMVFLAETEYIARIDGDDVCLPHRLALQMEAIASRPDCAVVGGQIEPIDEKGNATDFEMYLPNTYSSILDRLIIGNPICHPTVLMRREAVLQVGNYQDLAPVEDYELWLRMAKSYALFNVEQTLLKYRRHSKSITRDKPQSADENEQAFSFLSKSASDLFTISGATWTALQMKQISFTFPYFLKIAHALKKLDGQSCLSRFLSGSFTKVLYLKTKKNDYFTGALNLVLKGLKD